MSVLPIAYSCLPSLPTCPVLASHASARHRVIFWPKSALAPTAGRRRRLKCWGVRESSTAQGRSLAMRRRSYRALGVQPPCLSVAIVAGACRRCRRLSSCGSALSRRSASACSEARSSAKCRARAAAAQCGGLSSLRVPWLHSHPLDRNKCGRQEGSQKMRRRRTTTLSRQHSQV